MATSKEFCNYVLEELRDVPALTARPMMGEFLLYCDGVLIGGIYDERLLLKETKSVEPYNLPRVIPYDSAKRTMYYVEDFEGKPEVVELILKTRDELAP